MAADVGPGAADTFEPSVGEGAAVVPTDSLPLGSGTDVAWTVSAVGNPQAAKTRDKATFAMSPK